MMQRGLCIVALGAALATGSGGGGARYSQRGEWGNVLGTAERVSEAQLGVEVVEFVNEALNERLGLCRRCSYAGRPEIDAIDATRQVISFTKDGEAAYELQMRGWNGEVYNEKLLLGVLYNMTFSVTMRDTPPEGHTHSHHTLTLMGDREGLFSVVRHTWTWPAGRSASSADAEKAAAQPEHLSLLCYNIWNFNHPWPRRLELITRHIKDRNPDIIAFQEVCKKSKQTNKHTRDCTHL